MEWRRVGWSRALQQLWQVARAVWLWKADYRKPRKRHSDHYATETLPSRNFAFSLSLCLGCKGLGLAWLAAAKNQFFRAVLLWNSEKQGFAKKNRALKKVFSRTAHMKLREARLCIKTIFQALKKCFFHTALMKLRQAWLCIKTIFQALIFFRTALMKLRQARLCKRQFFRLWFFLFACLLSNLPTPPCYLV